MKKTLCAISLFLALSLLLCACGYTQEAVEDYPQIWLMEGNNLSASECYEYGKPSPLFPASLDGLTVTDYCARYDTLLPLGEAFQIFVSVRYETEESFEKELQRLEELAPISPSKYFDTPAAITVLGWQGCSEYALIDWKNLTVRYIFLQGGKLEDIEIPAEYLPTGLADYGEIEGVCENVYLAA